MVAGLGVSFSESAGGTTIVQATSAIKVTATGGPRA